MGSTPAEEGKQDVRDHDAGATELQGRGYRSLDDLRIEDNASIHKSSNGEQL